LIERTEALCVCLPVLRERQCRGLSFRKRAENWPGRSIHSDIDVDGAPSFPRTSYTYLRIIIIK
jgi:hypothetical protein